MGRSTTHRRQTTPTRMLWRGHRRPVCVEGGARVIDLVQVGRPHDRFFVVGVPDAVNRATYGLTEIHAEGWFEYDIGVEFQRSIADGVWPVSAARKPVRRVDFERSPCSTWYGSRAKPATVNGAGS